MLCCLGQYEQCQRGLNQCPGTCQVMESESICQCLQTDRYEEYPKLKELVMRKDEMVSVRATPPYYLKAHPPLVYRAALPGLPLL